MKKLELLMKMYRMERDSKKPCPKCKGKRWVWDKKNNSLKCTLCKGEGIAEG